MAADTVDTTAPTLVIVPRDGQPADLDLVLVFSEAVRAGDGSFSLSLANGRTLFDGPIAGNPAVQIDGRQLIVHLSSPLDQGELYHLALGSGAVTDLAGNKLFDGRDAAFDFRTATGPTGGPHINGTDGDDVLTASGYLAILDGGAGNDRLETQGAAHTLRGGDGDDTIQVSTSWNDALAHLPLRVDGGNGNDKMSFILSGPEIDVLAHGGSGSDTWYVSRTPTGGSLAIDDFQAGAGGDLINLSSFSAYAGPTPFGPQGSLRIEQRGADTAIMARLNGPNPDAFVDVLVLKNIDKTTLTQYNFWNGFNPDGSSTGLKLTAPDTGGRLDGGWLNDTLTGGIGNDVLYGNPGNDVLDGGAGDDTLIDNDGSQGGYAALINNDRLSGGDGNDTLRSQSGNDTLDGGSGNDTLTIVDVPDYVSRDGNTVVASGGAGQDTIIAQLSFAQGMQLQLSGGTGSDTFRIAGAPSARGDTILITDFETGAGGDVLDIFSSPWKGVTPFSGGYYKVIQRGADAVVQYDSDGPAGSASFRDLVVLQNVDIAKISPENTQGWRIDGDSRGVLLEGTAGPDQLAGGILSDTIRGGDGNDLLFGDSGDDVIEGGKDDDKLIDGSGNDLLDGGPGNDELVAVDGDDTLIGGAGNDHLVAGQGKTLLQGGDGDDLLEAVQATTNFDILLDGGAGNDTFRVGAWSSVAKPVIATGGAGQDIFEAGVLYIVNDFQTGAGGDLIDLAKALTGMPPSVTPFANGTLKLVQDGVYTVLQLFSNGPNGGYTIVLALKDVQTGALKAENFVQRVDLPAIPSLPGITVTGTAANDTIDGGAGADTLSGGPGYDFIHGREGNDVLDGGADPDILFGDEGDDTLSGGGGNDYLAGNAGSNSLFGQDGDDSLNADSLGNNLLDGGAGSDNLQGGAGNDTLIGGAGNDILSVSTYQGPNNRRVSAAGGDGDDILQFGLYENVEVTASGGSGADLFVFRDPHIELGVTITDFKAAEGDSLRLNLLFAPDFSGNPFGAAGYLKLEQAGADTKLYFDADGAAGPKAPKLLTTLRDVDAASLGTAAFAEGFDPKGGSKGVVLNGTSAGEVLAATWLDDTISGGAGNDVLFGYAGDDLLVGGDEVPYGGDALSGGAGNDTLRGGAGVDSLEGGYGNDMLFGDADDDRLDGNAGNDTLDGGDGNDMLYDGRGSNLMQGGAGDDTLADNTFYSEDERGDSTLDGGAGNDSITAGWGNDVVIGGDGNDVIRINAMVTAGQALTVKVDAGAGDDLIMTGGGYGSFTATVTAEITGGAGTDTYRFGGPLSVITDFQAGPGGDVLDVMPLVNDLPLHGNPFGADAYLRLQQDGADTLLQFDKDGAAGPAGFVTLARLKNLLPSQLTGDNFPFGIRPDGSPKGLDLSGGKGADRLIPCTAAQATTRSRAGTATTSCTATMATTTWMGTTAPTSFTAARATTRWSAPAAPVPTTGATATTACTPLAASMCCLAARAMTHSRPSAATVIGWKAVTVAIPWTSSAAATRPSTAAQATTLSWSTTPATIRRRPTPCRSTAAPATTLSNWI
jgi:Ca2+-binding RTX toxin-like protein